MKKILWYKNNNKNWLVLKNNPLQLKILLITLISKTQNRWFFNKKLIKKLYSKLHLNYIFSYKIILINFNT